MKKHCRFNGGFLSLTQKAVAQSYNITCFIKIYSLYCTSVSPTVRDQTWFDDDAKVVRQQSSLTRVVMWHKMKEVRNVYFMLEQCKRCAGTIVPEFFAVSQKRKKKTKKEKRNRVTERRSFVLDKTKIQNTFMCEKHHRCLQLKWKSSSPVSVKAEEGIKY